MTITFAGIPLLLEDPEGRAAKFVERYMEWPRSTVSAPARTIDPKSRVQRPKWPQTPKLRPNQLYIPTGATRWSQFIGLTDKATKDSILAAVVRGGAGALRMSLDDGVTVPVSPTGNTVDGARFDLQNRVDTEMLLLPPIPVNDQSDGLWILPMVDARFQWQSRAFISSAITWADLLDEISESLGLTTPFKRDDSADVNAAYGIPDACIFRNGLINTAAALDLYCWATNQRLCPVNRQWNQDTSYAVDDVVVNGGVFYTCTVAGDSDAGTGPSGLGVVTDDTVTWFGATSGAPTYVLRSYTTSSDLYTKQVAAQNSTYNSGQFSAGSPFDKSKSKDVPAAIKFHFTNDGATDRYAFSATSYPSWATGSTLDVMCPATFTGSNSTALLTVADRWANYFWQWTEHRFNWSFNRMLAWSLTGYEDYVLLDQSRTRRGNYNCRTFVKSLPATGWGMDVVPIQLSTGGNECSGSGGSSGGGGTGGGGCNCCDCTDCVNMCAQDFRQVVTACTACGGATPRKFAANFGDTIGTIDLVWSTGCTWESADFDVSYTYPTGVPGSTGQYKATFVQAGASSTCDITYVSGTDCLKVGSGHRILSWKADPNREWNCLCNMTMIPAVPSDRFPPNLYAPCELCIAPIAVPGGLGDWTICHVDAGCVQTLTLPENDYVSIDDPTAIPANWTAAIAKSDPESCCFTTITNDTDAEACSDSECFNLLLELDIDPVVYTAWSGSICISQDGFGAWIMTAAFHLTVGNSFGGTDLANHHVSYQIPVDDLVVGTNTLTFFNQTDSGLGGTITWPATIDIEVLEDCTFEQNNYDYGYGCGYGDVGGCSGCSFHTVSNGMGGWSWSVTSSDCAGCEAPFIDGCVTPEIDATEGATTTGPCDSI